jgi:hypothetical protein
MPPSTLMHFSISEDMPFARLYSVLSGETALSQKPFGIGHVHIHFLLRMTDTMTSQNTDLSSWDIL